MWNTWLNIFSSKEGREQEDERDTGRLRKAGRTLVALSALGLALIRFVPDAEALYLPLALYPDFDCELVYIGNDEVGLRIAHQAASGADGVTSYSFQDYQLTILRYIEGQPAESAPEVMSYTFPPDAGPREVFFYDQNVTQEVTYKYRIKGEFPFTKSSPGAPAESGTFSSTHDSRSIYGRYSATPGRVWGDLPRDTTWEGELNISGWLTIKDGLTLVVPSTVSVGGSSFGYIHVYGALQIDGATFTGDTPLVPHHIVAEEGNPQISIKNASIQSWLEIEASGHDAGLVFEGNSGDAYCSIELGAGANNARSISGNRVPNGRVSGSATGSITIENNKLLWIAMEGAAGSTPPFQGTVSIRGNEITEYISLKGLGGTGTAAIAENTFTGSRGWIELTDCLPEGTGALNISSNRALSYLMLDNVTRASIAGNEIGRSTSYAFNDYGIEIRKGSNNFIQGNTLVSPGISFGQTGIGLGFQQDAVTDNRILDNVFSGFDIGLGLGAATGNTISGNDFESNRVSIHLAGNPALGQIPPSGNSIWNNIFRKYPSGEHVRIDVAGDLNNGWNQPKTAGKNIVGGPFIGGNYWSDYDGQDADADGIGDSPFAIDADNTDLLPLIVPVLTLAVSENNPVNPEVTVAPEPYKEIDVLGFSLAVSSLAPGSVRIGGMQFEFVSDRAEASVVGAVYLVRHQAATYDLGTGAWSLARSDVIAQMPGAARMGFGGSHPLNEVLAPGERRDYTLRYLLEKTDPACTTYGARIAPDQIEATLDGASEPVIPMGETILGSVFLKGSTLTVSIFPEETATVTITPESLCYSWGDPVTVQITPDEGYAFDHFSDSFGLFGEGTNNPVTITMSWQDVLDLSGIAYLVEIIPLNGKNHGKAKDPINTASGEFYFDLPLFDLGGPMPLALSLHYGSAVPAKRDVALSFGEEMGPGWLHNYQILRIWKGDTRTRILYDRGTVLAFESEGDQWKLLNREDALYELKTDSSGYYYFLDPEKKWVYVFDEERKLCRIEDRNGNKHALSYDDSGYLSSVTDGLGRNLNFTHGADGRLLAVDDGSGRSYSFEYTDGALSSITDPMGRVTAFEYDASYRYPLLTRAIEPKGRSLYAQTYDGKGRVIAQTDAYENGSTLSVSEGETLIASPDGTSVTHTHADPVVLSGQGEPNLLTGVTDAQGAVTTIGYGGNNRRTSVTDRMGDRTTVTYHEESGNVARSTSALDQTIAIAYAEKERSYANPMTQEEIVFTFHDIARVDYPDGTAERFFHDGGGNMTSKVERDGRNWTSTYDSRGLPLTVTNPAGGTITYTYNNNGTLASSGDSDSGPISYIYDPWRRLSEIVNPDGTSTQMSYDLSGALVSLTDENGNRHTYSYDANQCLIKTTDPLDQEVRFGYDLMDRIKTVTDKLGHVSTFEYDEMGRLITTTDPNGLTNRFSYDPLGRLTGVNRGGASWQAGLDAEGVVISITTPLGRTTDYLSDKLGEATAATTPLNQTTTLERDAMGRRTAITDALSRRAAYGYDSLGQLSHVSLPAVGTAIYERDDLGLVKEITDLSGSTWSFTRSSMGRLLQTTDPLGRVSTHTYDARGRLFQTTYPDGQMLTRSYDGAGLLTGKLYSGGLDLTFTYDALGSLLAAPGLSLTRDAKGRPTATSNGEIRFEAGFDQADRLVHVDYNDGAFRVTYSYDPDTGLLSAVSDNLTGTRIELEFDTDQRLVGIKRSNGIHAGLSWDAAERLTGIRDGGILDLRYSLDAAGQIIGAEMNVPLDPMPLLSEGAEESGFDAASQLAASGYEFDSRGRQAASPRHTFDWDEASRLTRIDTVVLEYNGLGDLTARTEGGAVTRYHYNYAFAHPPIMAESDGLTGQMLRYYVCAPDGGLLYMIDAGDANRVYFYHFDRTGSTLALTDSSGAVTDAYAYSPYGRLLGHEGENPQPFTYAGKWGVRREGVNGDLYHMRARYYDAAAARFLSRDSLFPALEDPREINPYQYVAQNPVSYVDPAGMLKIDFQKLGTAGSYVAKNFLRVGKKVGAKSAKAQGNTTTKFGSYELKWWEAATLGILSQVPGAEEMANVAYFKKKPSIGTAEYISGGAFRDVAATPFTLTKFGLATLQDLAWWHVGGRDAPGKHANWWDKLFFGSAKWVAESEIIIPGVIEGCKAIEEGWTKIGEWQAYYSKNYLEPAGRQYGEDMYTVVSGDRKEQAALHSRLLRSRNPVTQAGLSAGKGYVAYQEAVRDWILSD